MVTQAMQRPQTKASTLSFMAGYFYKQGQYDKAASYYRNMGKIYCDDPGLGPDSAKYAWSLTTEARCLKHMNKQSQAVENCQKALAIIGAQTPETNRFEAMYLRDIVADATEVMGEAAFKAERAKHPLVPEPRLVGLAVSEIPNVKSALHDTEKSLSTQVDESGKHTAAAMKEVLYLANLYTLEANYAKADPLFKEVISFAETKFGPTHPMLITPLSNYGYMLKASGHKSEADAIQNRLHQIWTAHKPN